MQPRLFAFTLAIGVLGMLGLAQEPALGQGWECDSSFYGGSAYYAPRRTTYYSPSAYYAAPMYGQSFPDPMYGPSYPSSPRYGRTYSQPYSRAPAPPAKYGQPYSSARSGTPTYESPRASAPPRPMQPTTTVSVAMVDNQFQPNSINVQPGTTVRWTNNGTHAHTVTAQNDSWDSGDIKPGGTYSATFQQPGTYRYYCRHHGGMEGTIVVGQAAANGSARRPSSGY